MNKDWMKEDNLEEAEKCQEVRATCNAFYKYQAYAFLSSMAKKPAEAIKHLSDADREALKDLKSDVSEKGRTE